MKFKISLIQNKEFRENAKTLGKEQYCVPNVLSKLKTNYIKITEDTKVRIFDSESHFSKIEIYSHSFFERRDDKKNFI